MPPCAANEISPGEATTISTPSATEAQPAAVEAGPRFRALPPALKLVERAMVSAMTLLGAAWALELQHFAGISVFKEQYLALIFTIAMPAVFIGIKARASERGDRVPWYDWILALLSVVVGGYVVLNYRAIVWDLGTLVTERYLLGGLAILLVLEATRRATGWTLVILAVVFILYARYSHVFPGLLNVPGTSWPRLTNYLYLDNNGLFGLPLDVTASIIIAFILFGRTLYAANGDRVLTDFALATMGRYRGGPAKVAVLASTFFGTISGSAVSNVVMDGPITIPMMKRSGYPGHLAAATEAVASTGGQIMPPVMGITAFLIAEFLGIPYAEVVLAAIIPAVLYYVAVFMQIDLEAAKRGLQGLDPATLPRLRDVALRGWIFVVPIFILVWTLIAEGWQPGRSAMAAVIATVAVGTLQKETRPTLQRLATAVEETGRSILDLVVITAVAGLVIGALQVSGLSFNFSLILIALAAGSIVLLLAMTAVICTVLGMGMPTGVVYVMLAVLVSPALSEMGIVPIAAHLFLFYFGMMSMVTPPVCFATFAAATIAQTNFWRAGFAGMRLAIVAYIVPFVMVFQPGLVLEASFGQVVLTTLKTTVGVVILSLGMAGYLFRPLSPAVRATFALLGAAMMLTPYHAALGLPLLAVTLAAAAALAAVEYRARAA